MPALFTLINRSFTTGHNSAGRSLLPPSEYARLRTYTQLGDEVGADGFTWITFLHTNASASASDKGGEGREREEKEEKGKVIGSASAKPYHLPCADNGNESKKDVPDSVPLFKRQPGTERELQEHALLPKWEILVTVVDVELQGRGLAKELMDITLAEIRRRVSQGRDEGEEGKGEGKILLLLSTMQELNETYYAKRGWTTTGLRRFLPGTMGSRDGFGVVEMMRVVDA